MSQVLSQTQWLVFPLVTVVMFTMLFTATLFWICRRGAREEYARRGLSALDDGAVRGDRHG
jgi:cbb3-type cytochrome oxidase subunit 3